MSFTTKKRRAGIAAAAAVSAIAVFGVAGGVGLAGGLASLHQYGAGAGQYQYGKQKVTICHKGKRTLRISIRAWPKHSKNHGDTMGACAELKKNHGNKHGDKHGKKSASTSSSNAVAKSSGKSEDSYGKSEGHGKGKNR